MNRHARYHCGLDRDGLLRWRLKSASEARRCSQQRVLLPRVVVRASSVRDVWRNGLQRRQWTVLVQQVRADRRCFLTTLRRPPLISPVLPGF